MQFSIKKKINNSQNQELILFCSKNAEQIIIHSSNSYWESLLSRIPEKNLFSDSGKCFQFYQEGGFERISLITLPQNANGDFRERLRRLFVQSAKKIRESEKIVFDLLEIDTIEKIFKLENSELIKLLVESFELGLYRFGKYQAKDDPSKIKTAQFACSNKKAQEVLHSSVALSRAALVARDLMNEPGNELGPKELIDVTRKLSKDSEFNYTVLSKSKMTQLKMGGILAVNQGTNKEPYLGIADYSPKNFKKTILIVGKGVTFDSGGISIKPSAGMGEMKMDMGGAAAVIGMLSGLKDLAIASRVVGMTPAVENMPGPDAQRPGDIIRMYNKKTVEVDNTDAEGRLILADALAYGIEKYKPDLVIDLATLTGACIIALGYYRAAAVGNNDEAIRTLKEVGDRCGEKIWQLPIDEDYTALMDSDVADIKNAGGRAAGTITAAGFLSHFTGNTPWIHLDIAGTAMTDKATGLFNKGGTGFGARLLLEFLKVYQ